MIVRFKSDGSEWVVDSEICLVRKEDYGRLRPWTRLWPDFVYRALKGGEEWKLEYDVVGSREELLAKEPGGVESVSSARLRKAYERRVLLQSASSSMPEAEDTTSEEYGDISVFSSNANDANSSRDTSEAWEEERTERSDAFA